MISTIFGTVLSSKPAQWALAVVGAVVALALILVRAFYAGKAAQKVDNLEQSLDNVEKAREAVREVDTAAVRGDVPDGVRKFYIDGFLPRNAGTDPQQPPESPGVTPRH